MESYLHRIVGLYPTHAFADQARNDLLAQGFAPAQLHLLEPGSTTGGQDATADSDDVLKDLLRDGAIGTAIGTAAGAGVTIAMAAANLTLFIANPVFGAMYLLGWGASLGGLLGAVVGSERSSGDISSLIKDALEADQFVLVAYAVSEPQTTQAQEIITASMGIEPSTSVVEGASLSR